MIIIKGDILYLQVNLAFQGNRVHPAIQGDQQVQGVLEVQDHQFLLLGQVLLSVL